MTSGRAPTALRPHQPVHEALDAMATGGVRQLPVIDLDDKVIGLIDEAAIAREVLRAHARKR